MQAMKSRFGHTCLKNKKKKEKNKKGYCKAFCVTCKHTKCQNMRNWVFLFDATSYEKLLIWNNDV